MKSSRFMKSGISLRINAERVCLQTMSTNGSKTKQKPQVGLRIVTDEQKDAYITDYYAREGVQLERNKIGKNFGRKQVAKLMLNSSGEIWRETQQDAHIYSHKPWSTVSDY